jgi:hypothetical protein
VVSLTAVFACAAWAEVPAGIFIIKDLLTVKEDRCRAGPDGQRSRYRLVVMETQAWLCRSCARI